MDQNKDRNPLSGPRHGTQYPHPDTGGHLDPRVDEARARQADSVNQCAEDRDFTDARRAIGNVVRRRQSEFAVQLAGVWHRASVFGSLMSQALGTISRDEAIDALKLEIGEELEKLR
jgi:hypothetical protein